MIIKTRPRFVSFDLDFESGVYELDVFYQTSYDPIDGEEIELVEALLRRQSLWVSEQPDGKEIDMKFETNVAPTDAYAKQFGDWALDRIKDGNGQWGAIKEELMDRCRVDMAV